MTAAAAAVLEIAPDLLGDEYYAVLAEGSWLDSKLSAGGTAAARLDEQLTAARQALGTIASGGG